MSTKRIVPWIDYTEFETVYQWLFADRKTEQDTVQRGVDRVQAWTNRGEVPSAVEMTAAFIAIILRDEQTTNMSHKELRLMYGMAVIRFVNGLVDPAQKKLFAKSVTTIARTIGLPSWFVDLRHAGTHERLPSVTVLRAAAIQAVGWLHDNYWIRNIKPEHEKSAFLQNTEIKNKLNGYKECRKSFLKEKYGGNPKTDPTTYVAAIEALIEIIDDDDVIQNDIIPLLLGVGGLVPTGKKKRASAEDMSISKGLIELWTPLIQGLDVGFPSFGSQLVSSIIQKLNTNYDFVLDENILNPYAAFAVQTAEDPTKSPTYLLTLTCWLRHFVNEFGVTPFNRTLSHLTMDDILESCLRNPNYYTRSVLQSVVNVDPEVGQSIKPFTRYMDQMLMKSIQPDTQEKRKQSTLPTLEENELQAELDALQTQLAEVQAAEADVLIVKQRGQKRKVEKILDLDLSWKLYHDWRPCPMGTLPNGKVPCLDMPQTSHAALNL